MGIISRLIEMQKTISEYESFAADLVCILHSEKPIVLDRYTGIPRMVFYDVSKMKEENEELHKNLKALKAGYEIMQNQILAYEKESHKNDSNENMD